MLKMRVLLTKHNTTKCLRLVTLYLLSSLHWQYPFVSSPLSLSFSCQMTCTLTNTSIKKINICAFLSCAYPRDYIAEQFCLMLALQRSYSYNTIHNCLALLWISNHRCLPAQQKVSHNLRILEGRGDRFLKNTQPCAWQYCYNVLSFWQKNLKLCLILAASAVWEAFAQLSRACYREAFLDIRLYFLHFILLHLVNFNVLYYLDCYLHICVSQICTKLGSFYFGATYVEDNIQFLEKSQKQFYIGYFSALL